MKGLTGVPLLGRQGLVHCVGVTRAVAFALTLRTGLLGRFLSTALVLAVVKRREGQNVEEE